MDVFGVCSRLCAAVLLFQCLLQTLVHSKDESSCQYKLNTLWTASLRDSPLAATPTFFDVDGDSYGDIVAPSFSGEVWAVHGESGHIVDNWPFYLEERAFHASPLVYDVNKDGELEFLLTTSDGEIVFLHTNNSLLHGETIKIAPLKVRREWYKLDKEYIEKIAQELTKQLGDSARLKIGLGNEGGRENKPPTAEKGPPNLHAHSEAFSEFESRYGLHADPLYSRHLKEKYVFGLHPGDEGSVYIEPHVLATPTLADINGDGLFNELVVPVSYYFDPFFYGDPHNLGKLGGLDGEELAHFVAGGLVIFDLNTGAVIGQKVLGLTEASDSQPAYMLSSPTVVRLFPGVGGAVIIITMATGEVHMLEAGSLESVSGFPVRLDSVSASVAVADLFQDGVLELVVGDNSGNIYCIDSRGGRKWEFETHEAVQSDVRFTDFDGDSQLDVVFVTTYGSLWVLRGVSGTPFPGYPVRLNTHTQSSPLLIHLSHTDSEREPALTAVLPGMTDLFLVDLSSRCVESVSTDSVILSVLSSDIDPYSPGIELLTVGLDGKMTCYSTPLTKMTQREVFLQSWDVNVMGHTRFTHRLNSLSVLLPWEHDTSVDLHGNSFNLEVVVLDNAQRRSKQITLSVSIGRKYLLYNSTLPLYHKTTTHNVLVPTPREPMTSFITVTVCTEYLQCESESRHVRFNLRYRSLLQWYLSGPFLALIAAFLWLLRDADFEPLPVAIYGSTNRKSL